MYHNVVIRYSLTGQYTDVEYFDIFEIEIVSKAMSFLNKSF